VKGNLETKAFQFGPYRLDSSVWHSGGAGGSNDESERKVLEDAWLSTCDREHPHYRLSASRIVHSSDNSFVARHVVLKFGSVPVFYFPILWGRTDDRRSLLIKPGYSSRRGAYLEISRSWAIADLGMSKMQLDLMSKRGVGLGNTTHLKTESQALDVNLYGVLDSDPPETEPGFNRRFKETHDRYRLHSYYQNRLTDDLALRLNIDFLSDIDMLEDWFKSEYEHNPQPSTFANAVYDAQRYSLSLGARPRLNDFYTVVEDLPELRLEMPRQTVSDCFPLLYQSTTTAGYYQMDWREFDLDRAFPLTDPEDYDSMRFDTLHMVYLPFTVAQNLQVVPRAGVRLTHYSDSSETAMGPADIDALFAVDDPDDPRNETEILRNYDDEGGSLTRLAGEFGVEASTKFHRVWPNVTNETLNVDGLRHIVKPYVNYTFAPDPTEDREHIYFFDEVDRLTEQNFVRVGTDQRFQTRRHRQIYTLARVQSYADFHFTDENSNDQDYSDGFGDLGNKIEFTPTDALKTWMSLVADLDEMDVRRAETGVRVGRKDGIRFSLAYIYRDNYYPRSAYSMGSSLLDLTGEHGYLTREELETQTAVGEVTFPINEKTSGRIRLEYDVEEADLARQIYEIIRDLHCWMGSLALSEDNGDVRIMVMMYLKAYPSTKLDVGI